MTDFSTKRFDDRVLDRADDGGAFERFVDEFLRVQSPAGNLVRGLAKGRDGAIDLFDSDRPIEHIVECKFIGAKTDGTARQRWGEVRNNLKANLPPLARGESSGRVRYRPWLKSHGALRTYTFVTSAIAAGADERTALRRDTSDFFVGLSRAHPELSHLRDLEIDLRYWDDLVGQAGRFAPLFYRWFGGLPLGYGEIALSFGSETGFKRFLESGRLPYSGRDAFLAETGVEGPSHLRGSLRGSGATPRGDEPARE